MKVAYVSPFPPEEGGVAHYSRQLLSALLDFIDNYIVISRRCNAESAKNQEIFPILGRNLGSISMAKSIIENFDPDIIHIQSDTFSFMPWLPLLSKALEYPKIVTSHEVLINRKKRLYANQPWIIEPFIKYGILLYEKIFYESVTKVIVHNQLLKRRLIESYGIAPQKIHVIPHGTNCNVFPKSDYCKHDMILFMGSLSPHKGLDLLVDAFEKLVNKDLKLELVVVGSLPFGIIKKTRWLRRLRNKIDNSPAKPNILFTGWVDFNKIDFFMKYSDLIVLPYKTVSTSGVAARALAYGIPIIATNVGGFKHQIINGETGILVEPNSSEQLELTMLNLLNDEDSRRRFGKNAREYAEKYLDWKIIAREHFMLYKETISRALPTVN